MLGVCDNGTVDNVQQKWSTENVYLKSSIFYKRLTNATVINTRTLMPWCYTAVDIGCTCGNQNNGNTCE